MADNFVKEAIRGADNLSLAISMVAAIAIGFAIGYGLRALFGYEWLLWLGVAWGAAAAILNVAKAIRRLRREMKELENNPRYKQYAKPAPQDDDDEDN
ncbi:MAG: AtpZ/AtpI family protein [Helicobacteraceae bacterium]|jgi:F0F1-type ATP synthase assembly protein I|nr:AtpZ/AtpI family protein [Helicobacteraceae bacterium]